MARVIYALMLACIGLWLALGATQVARAATTSISTCTDSALTSAIAAGGTVVFQVDCPDLVLGQSISIPSTLTVDIEANGHTVVLDGSSIRRHFVVNGGHLTIGGLTLKNGMVRGLDGVAGTAGGTGQDGSAGESGKNGIPGGCSVGSDVGGNGSTGTAGSAGTAGTAGKGGTVAQGGSILIRSGVVSLSGDSFSNNQAIGGTGASGGAGGPGGAGGQGGYGGNGAEGATDLITGKPCHRRRRRNRGSRSCWRQRRRGWSRWRRWCGAGWRNLQCRNALPLVLLV